MGGVGAAGRSEEGLDDGCGRSRLMPSFLAMEKRKEGGSIAMEKRKEGGSIATDAKLRVS